MLLLNLKNVGELVLGDGNLRKMLPQRSHHFDAWKLGVMVPALRATAKKAALEFLDNADDEIVMVLNEYFGQDVMVERIQHKIVKNLTISLDKLQESLNECDGYQICLSTDGQNAFLTLWR